MNFTDIDRIVKLFKTIWILSLFDVKVNQRLSRKRTTSHSFEIILKLDIRIY